MATVDKEFADRVVAANGVLYPDDPFELPITRIVEYKNAWGGIGYGMVFEGQDQDKYMRPSEFIGSPRIYFQREA